MSWLRMCETSQCSALQVLPCCPASSMTVWQRVSHGAMNTSLGQCHLYRTQTSEWISLYRRSLAYASVYRYSACRLLIRKKKQIKKKILAWLSKAYDCDRTLLHLSSLKHLHAQYRYFLGCCRLDQEASLPGSIQLTRRQLYDHSCSIHFLPYKAYLEKTEDCSHIKITGLQYSKSFNGRCWKTGTNHRGVCLNKTMLTIPCFHLTVWRDNRKEGNNEHKAQRKVNFHLSLDEADTQQKGKRSICNLLQAKSQHQWDWDHLQD